MARVSGVSHAVVMAGLLCFSVIQIGCGDGQRRRALVTVDGSSTVYPIAEAVSEEFQIENPQFVVVPGRSGTGGGFNRFCRGETDVSTASRRILPSEVSDCSGKGVDFLEIPIALDGLSVIVNAQNDLVDCLTVQELRSIWRPESRVRVWRDVRPEFPNAEIQLYGPGTDSGTYDTFTEAIVGEVGASRTDFQASEDDNVLVQGITGDRYALGFFGYAYLEHNRSRLRVVAVDGGGGCVQPTVETIRDGSYTPLGRILFLYVKRESLENPGVRAFLEYFLTHAVSIIPETGLVPLSESTYEANLARLDREAGEAEVPDSSLETGGGAE